MWRSGRTFTDTERELFHYLAAQAAISLDNVALHETVQRQAVTDELTGLFNHRRFQEGLTQEIERARRFGQGLGLVMLDIDNFKQVNDTYGHQVGDLVLAEVARVLKEYSREIDEPARYGGEELAVVLPGTDLEGAYNLAERVRTGIEALEFPLDGRGKLRVTASFGAAAMPETATRPVVAHRGRRHRPVRGQAVGQEPHRARRAGTRPAYSVTWRRHGTARRRDPRAPGAQAPAWRRPDRGRAPGTRGVRRCAARGRRAAAAGA